mgnify:CR=1 FL=1
MSEIFSSTPFILLLVLGSYLAGCKLYRKKHIALFHPLLVAMVLIIALLSFRTLGRCTGICPLRTNRANQRKRDTRTYCCLCRRYRRYSKCHSYLQNHGSRRGYHLVTATQIGNHTHRYLLVGTLEWHTVAHRSYRIWLRAFGWYRRSCHSRPLPRQQPSSQRACLRFGGTWARNGTSHRIGSRRRGYQWLGHRADGSYHLFTYTSL